MSKKEQNDWLESYRNLPIVVDIDPGFILIGTLSDYSSEHIVVSDADLHNHQKANSSKELYLYEAYRFGVNINRKEVTIPRHRVIAVSKLQDTDIT